MPGAARALGTLNPPDITVATGSGPAGVLADGETVVDDDDDEDDATVGWVDVVPGAASSLPLHPATTRTPTTPTVARRSRRRCDR